VHGTNPAKGYHQCAKIVGFAAQQHAQEPSLNPIVKSSKLANVAYDIRGPVLDKARQMEEEGQKIIKLNIGNVAAFGLEPPDEIVQDMIRNLPHAAGYTDSKGLFAPRKAVVHSPSRRASRA
jgi:alanine-synthesizing transaminase